MDKSASSAHFHILASAHRLVRPFFALALITMMTVALLSKGIFDTGDGITHYQIARWSWRHPELFLHHWGKPLFTLIASLPAQFGYKGIVVFNVLCHIGTGWLTWRIADRMKLPYAFLAGPLLIFAPISWGVAQSGLTEPLFALTLMLAIYFITGGRYTMAAVIISLLPFVRTEGFTLAPLFGLFFLVRKEFLPIALLACGTIVYSVIGGLFVHHDFLWVFHQNPYKGEASYGHGEFFHFIGRSEFIFGWAMTLLTGMGIVTIPFRKRFTPIHSMTEIILIAGCFILFFAAHSIFWWKGLFGSYGLIRVMACVLPCAVLLSLRGLQLATSLFASRKLLRAGIAMIVVVLTMFNTFSQHHLVLLPDERQVAQQEVADAIHTQHLETRLMFYGHPVMTHLLNKDPFDQAQCIEMYGLPESQAFPAGAIVVWDQHFGTVQHMVSEEQLLAHPQLHEVIRIDKRPPGEKTNDPFWIVCEVK